MVVMDSSPARACFVSELERGSLTDWWLLELVGSQCPAPFPGQPRNSEKTVQGVEAHRRSNHVSKVGRPAPPRKEAALGVSYLLAPWSSTQHPFASSPGTLTVCCFSLPSL